MTHKQKHRMDMKQGPRRSPGWLITFTDLMALLLTFFVLLVSFSSVEQVKFQKALGSLQGALGVLPKRQSVIFQKERLIPQLSDYKNRRIRRVAIELRNLIREKNLLENIKLQQTENGIIIRIDSPILFDIGKADLKPKAYPILDKIIEMTRDWPNQIRIEGHTDDLPIHTTQFPSNWELSTARALSVLRYFLTRGGIEPYRLAAAGYGEYRPLVPNSSEQNRAKNRRVEIYVEQKYNRLLIREATF